MLADVERIAEAGFVPPVAEMRALIGPRIRAVVPMSPSNPTGATDPATVPARLCLAREGGLALVVAVRPFRHCRVA